MSWRKPATEGDPVGVTVTPAPATVTSGDTFRVTVVFDVAPPYEIHARIAPAPDVATRLVLKLPVGLRAVGDWSAPEPLPSAASDRHLAYGGRAAFSRTVLIDTDAPAGDYKFICSIRYQACTAAACLAPVQLDAPVSVLVRRE
jgi:hypothetical protein